MARLTDRWFQDPSFIQDEIETSKDPVNTGAILFRKSNLVIETLDFGTIATKDTEAAARTVDIVGLTLEYTGYYPVEVFGFHLYDILIEDYSGLKTPEHDTQEILRWANWFYNPLNKDDNTRPGLHIRQTVSVDGAASAPVWRTFRDTEEGVINPVGYRGADSGHAMPLLFDTPNLQAGNALLVPGDRIQFALKLIAPCSSYGEVTEALSVRLGFGVHFQEMSAVESNAARPDRWAGVCGD